METTHGDNQILTTDANGGSMPPGALLAAAREARGLTVADVARALKLSVAQVDALEAGDDSCFSSPVFVRGFLRNYARLLNVDIAPVMPAMATPVAALKRDQRLMHYKPGVALEPKRGRRLPALLAMMTFAVLGLAYYEFVWNVPQQPVNLTKSEQTVLGYSGTALIGQVPTASERLVLKESREAAAGAMEKGLRFSFNRESWVEVRGGDGKVLFSTVNAPGSERVVQGEPPFTLVIGAASGVELRYNGNRVDLASYVNEDVARLRLE